MDKFYWKRWDLKLESKQALCPQTFALEWPTSRFISILTDYELVLRSTIGRADKVGGVLGGEKYHFSLDSVSFEDKESNSIFYS